MTDTSEQAPSASAGTGRPLVVLANVNKHFGELHVLRDINLSVGSGEVVVVIGPSGSGKSTLCRAINRLEPIDSGEIRLDGELLPAEGKALAQLRADVGMVFQSFNLFQHKTVLENVTLGPIKVRKKSKKAAEEKATALLERVGRRQPGRQIPCPAVRRATAARRHRACTRDGTQGHPVRRANFGTRP